MSLGSKGEQLKMFMPAQELRSMDSFEVHDSGPSADSLWSSKQPTPSLTESVRQTGVQEPVEVWHGMRRADSQPAPMLVDGHHRVQAALSSNQLVPVRHSEAPAMFRESFYP